jgi:phosphotransferase system HPr (HPr) family protein
VAEVTLRIANPKGLHIRPIMDIADLATQFGARIVVHKAEAQADATSVMQLLALGMQAGDEIRIVAEGDDAHKAVTELVDLIDKTLREA